MAIKAAAHDSQGRAKQQLNTCTRMQVADRFSRSQSWTNSHKLHNYTSRLLIRHVQECKLLTVSQEARRHSVVDKLHINVFKSGLKAWEVY